MIFQLLKGTIACWHLSILWLLCWNVVVRYVPLAIPVFLARFLAASRFSFPQLGLIIISPAVAWQPLPNFYLPKVIVVL